MEDKKIKLNTEYEELLNSIIGDKRESEQRKFEKESLVGKLDINEEKEDDTNIEINSNLEDIQNQINEVEKVEKLNIEWDKIKVDNRGIPILTNKDKEIAYTLGLFTKEMIDESILVLENPNKFGKELTDASRRLLAIAQETVKNKDLKEYAEEINTSNIKGLKKASFIAKYKDQVFDVIKDNNLIEDLDIAKRSWIKMLLLNLKNKNNFISIFHIPNLLITRTYINKISKRISRHDNSQIMMNRCNVVNNMFSFIRLLYEDPEKKFINPNTLLIFKHKSCKQDYLNFYKSLIDLIINSEMFSVTILNELKNIKNNPNVEDLCITRIFQLSRNPHWFKMKVRMGLLTKQKEILNKKIKSNYKSGKTKKISNNTKELLKVETELQYIKYFYNLINKLEEFYKNSTFVSFLTLINDEDIDSNYIKWKTNGKSEDRLLDSILDNCLEIFKIMIFINLETVIQNAYFVLLEYTDKINNMVSDEFVNINSIFLQELNLLVNTDFDLTSTSLVLDIHDNLYINKIKYAFGIDKDLDFNTEMRSFFEKFRKDFFSYLYHIIKNMLNAGF